MKCPICRDEVLCQNCGPFEVKDWEEEFVALQKDNEEKIRLLHKKHGTMPDEYAKLKEQYDELIKRIEIANLAMKKLLGGIE
jgi:predicted nuclease with TOPRIM domain